MGKTRYQFITAHSHPREGKITNYKILSNLFLFLPIGFTVVGLIFRSKHTYFQFYFYIHNMDFIVYKRSNFIYVYVHISRMLFQKKIYQDVQQLCIVQRYVKNKKLKTRKFINKLIYWLELGWIFLYMKRINNTSHPYINKYIYFPPLHYQRIVIIRNFKVYKIKFTFFIWIVKIYNKTSTCEI